jgi:hypothetical protein
MTLRAKEEDELPLEPRPLADHVTVEVERPALPEPPPMRRANYLPAPAVFNLNAACRLVNDALGDKGYGCYLVGSSLRKRDYRDVDVRYIMADEAFDLMFPGAMPGPFQIHPLWALFCTSVSTWLRQQTGLPVDFQVQRMTQANEDYSRKTGHGREPLGVFLCPNPADQA